MGFQIAIDGPAAAGKTTAAKEVASQLGFIYVDTGAMYRAIALYCIENGLPMKDRSVMSKAVEDIDITIGQDNGMQMVYLNGRNVTGNIRTAAVGNGASDVSTVPEVRAKLVAIQKKMAETADIVMEGRDICTSVLPGAQVKIFLTASVDERARRRYQELEDKGMPCELEELKEDIMRRDYQDTHRDVSPLRKAPGAVEIDSTDISANDVAKMIVELARMGGTKKVIE